MKKLTVTFDPSQTWNTDTWHRSFNGKMPRESIKFVLDAVTTIFHSYLHDIPCGIPQGLEGLIELLTETPKREVIKKAIRKSNRMVAFVPNVTVGGIWVEISFCTGKKKDYGLSLQYEWDTKKFQTYLPPS